MSLAGCQIKLIDISFHLQKTLESFDKNSTDKILFIKCPPSCQLGLMGCKGFTTVLETTHFWGGVYTVCLN